MKSLKFIFFAIALSMFITDGIAADTLYVYLANDNPVQSIPLNNVRRLTFDEDNMLLKAANGDEISYPLATVGKITFKEDAAVTGISVSQNEVEIKLYPNPFTDYIIIDSPVDITSWTLFDLNGKILKHSVATLQIQVSNLPAGIYFLKIDSANGIITRKIIKQ